MAEEENRAPDDTGREWSEELTEEERERREKLIRRITELLCADVLKDADCIAIYEIMLKACRREAADLAERIMIESLEEDTDE